MNNIKERLENNELLGVIKYKNEYHFYMMPIAYWILNYIKYDPTYDPQEWNFIFRNNILNVEDKDVEAFIFSIKNEQVEWAQLIHFLKDVPKEYGQIFFLIDFDDRLFINCFPEIDIQEYLPDSRWKGKFDDPISYLPNEMKVIR